MVLIKECWGIGKSNRQTNQKRQQIDEVTGSRQYVFSEDYFDVVPPAIYNSRTLQGANMLRMRQAHAANEKGQGGCVGFDHHRAKTQAAVNTW